MNVCTIQSCPSDCKCKSKDRYRPDKPEPVSFFQSSVCRVCLGTHVRMYHMSEHGLSAVYAQVVGVQINTEDKLPQQLCWECVGRLSSANRFIQKAVKTQCILTKKINESVLITISDIESIDRAQHKLESTLGTKLNTVNEYDFLFTEETVDSNNFCNMHSDSYEGISHIELNGNKEKQILEIKEVTIEIDPIKTEQVFVHVKEEPLNNYTTDNKERYADSEDVNFSIEELAITIKQESTSDDEVSGDDESVSEMSQEGRQLVDKSSAVCEVVKQSRKRSNNSLSLLRNQRSKMSTGYKEGIGWTVYNTEHSSKQVIASADLSTKHITRETKNAIPSNNKIKFEEDISEFPADCLDSVKHPRSVINSPASTSYNINTNMSLTRKINKSIISGIENLQKLFICDICNKSFHHKPDLILHLQKHPKIHHCTYCSYKTCRKGNLKIHVNAKHTKNEVFNCALCSYKTYLKTTLSKHVNSKHTRIEIFNCTFCSYNATQKSDLLRHVNAIHTKSEAFNCPHCSYKAYQKSALSTHVNTQHTKSLFFNCPHCSFKAYRKMTLLAHVNAKHTKSQVFRCSHCSFKSYYRISLVTHLNNQH